MRALVLGGSGLIGNAIVRRLVAEDCRVTAVGRRRERPANLGRVPAEYVAANIDALDQLDALVAGHDVVVDAAAPYALNAFHAATPAERQPVEHARARAHALLTAALRHGAAFGYVGTRPARSGNDLRSVQSRFAHRLQPYFAVKKTIEQCVMHAASRGLRTVIVRPSACFGPWDMKPRELCWLPALVRGELPLMLRHRVNVVDTRDVADVMVEALWSGRGAIDVDAVGHDTSVEALFSLVCELADARLPQWSMPAEIAVFPALWAELGWAVLGRPSPLPSLALMLLCEQEWAGDAALGAARPARRELVVTARDALAWYRTLGYC